MNLTEKTLLTILKIKYTLSYSVFLTYGTVKKLKDYIPVFTNSLSELASNIISNFKTVVLPYVQLFLNNFNTIIKEGTTYTKNMYNSRQIIYVPDNPSNTVVSKAFAYCSSLLYSDFLITSKHTYIDNLFIGCQSLVNFRWDEWDVSNIKNADFWFQVSGNNNCKITLDINRFSRVLDGTYTGTIYYLYYRSSIVKRIIGIEHALQQAHQLILYDCFNLEQIDGIEDLVIPNEGGVHPLGTYALRETQKLNINLKVRALYTVTKEIPTWETCYNSGITGLDLSSLEYDYAANTELYEVRNGFIFPKNKTYRGNAYLLHNCKALTSFKGEDRSLIQYSYVDKSGAECYSYDRINSPEVLINISEYILLPHEGGSIRHNLNLESKNLTNESIISIFNELVDWNSERYQVDYYNAIKDDMKDPSVYFSDITNGRHIITVRKAVKNRITSDPELTHLIAQTSRRGWVLTTSY